MHLAVIRVLEFGVRPNTAGVIALFVWHLELYGAVSGFFDAFMHFSVKQIPLLQQVARQRKMPVFATLKTVNNIYKLKGDSNDSVKPKRPKSTDQKTVSQTHLTGLKATTSAQITCLQSGLGHQRNKRLD